MPNYTTLSVRLPTELRREIDQFAAATGRSRSAFIREAVEIYLEEKKAYHASIEEALKEVEEGVFISGEKVIEWLESWGTDNELPRQSLISFRIASPDANLRQSELERWKPSGRYSNGCWRCCR